jgi:hypothetical protein
MSSNQTLQDFDIVIMVVELVDTTKRLNRNKNTVLLLAVKDELLPYLIIVPLLSSLSNNKNSKTYTFISRYHYDFNTDAEHGRLSGRRPKVLS